MVQGIPPIHHLIDLTLHHSKKRRKGVQLSATGLSYSLASLAKPTISKSHEELHTTFINSAALTFCKASAHHTTLGLINLQQITQRKTPISTTPETFNSSHSCHFQNSTPNMLIHQVFIRDAFISPLFIPHQVFLCLLPALASCAKMLDPHYFVEANQRIFTILHPNFIFTVQQWSCAYTLNSYFTQDN